MDPAAHLEKLEAIARLVLKKFKQIPDLLSAKVAVIGGMAVCKYTNYRITKDVDFSIAAEGAPNSIKEKLLALENSPFEARASYFGVRIDNIFYQVDILNMKHLPYVPDGAIEVRNVSDEIPYISEVDLLVSKIFACGLRIENLKRARDANDAHYLIRQMADFKLNDEQKNAIRGHAIKDLANSCKHQSDVEWWIKKLGL